MYKLYFFSKAREEFSSLNKEAQMEIKNKLDILGDNPEIILRMKSFRKLATVKNGYRIRVGRYRILFVIIVNKEQIWVCDIFVKKSENDYKKAIKRLIEKGIFNGW